MANLQKAINISQRPKKVTLAQVKKIVEEIQK